MAAWTLRERELRHELTAVRAGRADAAEPPSEETGLDRGELRDAITAARTSGGVRRPRWADELLGDPDHRDRP